MCGHKRCRDTGLSHGLYCLYCSTATMLLNSFDLYQVAPLPAVLRHNQEVYLRMLPMDSGMQGRGHHLSRGQLCHATKPIGQQTVPQSVQGFV